MVTAFIFFLHLSFLLYIFTYKWQNESLTTAFVNLALIIILFSVGWSLATMLIKAVAPPQGLGLQFDRDTMSLTALSIAEYFFYKFYYSESPATEDGKEK